MVHAQLQALTNFLASLPGVANIKTLSPEHSDHVVIFVGQWHYTPSQYRPGNLAPAEFLELLAQTHKEIFSIGTNLQVRFGINSYYAEGCTDANLLDFTSMVERARKARQFEKEFQEARNESLEKMQKHLRGLLDNPIVKTNKELRDKVDVRVRRAERLKEDYVSIPFGDEVHPHDLRLAVEAGMRLKRSENNLSYNRAMDLVFKGNPRQESLNDLDQILLEDRNVGVLSIIARDYQSGIETGPYSLLIFGDKHDFARSAAVWNTTNNFKFSVITVTPKSIK